MYSERALFALYELSQAGLVVDHSFPTDKERPRLYQEDCVELFLAPDPARPSRYYEIELGPAGHFLDLEVDRERKVENVAWSSGVVVATSSDAAARTAVIEARFTAPEIVAALKPGARLPLALFRMDGKAPRRYLAWRPPRSKKPNFHVPEAFGTLVIDG
jgi:hypothetical protein